MKKILAFLLGMMLILPMILSAGAAEDFEPEEPETYNELQSSDKFENPFEIKTGVLYQGKGINHYLLMFRAEETGEYSIYYRSTEMNGNFGFYLEDKYGGQLNEFRNSSDSRTVPGIARVELTGGKTYRIKGMFNKSFFASCMPDAPFYLAICSPSHHTGHLTASRIVKEPACSEPGIEAHCCSLCGSEVDRRTLPALGHQPGKEQIFEEASCMAAGVRGIKCERCGEYLTRTPIPMTAHTPDVWVDLRAATCTADGTRVQRCRVCGETLKTETVPAFGHSYSEWTSAGGTQECRSCIYCGHTEYRDVQ